MKSLKTLGNEFVSTLKNSQKKTSDMLLTILFVVYIVFNLKLPDMVSNFVNTTMGMIVVVLGVLSLFLTKNPVLVVLGFVVGYELLRRSHVDTGVYAMEHHLPSEERKKAEFEAMKQHEDTLEQEMVNNIKPLVPPPEGSVSYKPTTDKTHKAAKSTHDGSI